MRSLCRRGLAAGAVLALALSAAPPARAESVHGASLPNTVRRVAPGRFKSLQDWGRTMRHFYSAYGRSEGIVFREIDTTPKVKAVHIANIRRGRTWDGINVYEVGDEVFIYVIEANREGRKEK